MYVYYMFTIDIPPEVDNYHNLFPLEPPQGNNLQKSTTFGYPTTCYKAVNTKDGMTYCLKRIHGKMGTVCPEAFFLSSIEFDVT